jgi:hypothetical protein
MRPRGGPASARPEPPERNRRVTNLTQTLRKRKMKSRWADAMHRCSDPAYLARVSRSSASSTLSIFFSSCCNRISLIPSRASMNKNPSLTM